MASRFTIAKDRLLDDLEDVILSVWQAQVKHRRRALWNVRNPFRSGSHEGQTVIWLTGERRGAFKDFVSGDKGDAIDMLAYGLTGDVNADSRMQAVEWIEDRYGIRTMSAEQKQKAEAEAKTRRKIVEAKDARRRESNLTRARKMFFGCKAGIRDTLAEVYLNGRDIDLARVGPLVDNTFRFSAAFEHWLEEDKPRFPAMVSAMVSEKGKIGACHVTYLAADGLTKAPVGKAKMMWPESAGLMIRVTQGETGMTLEAAAEAKRASILGVTEGIEDALSAAMLDPALRMWSAGSLSGLLYLPDSPAISAYLVFKDNDWGKPQAQRLFDRALQRIRGFGKPVEVVQMPAGLGKDVNDALRSI